MPQRFFRLAMLAWLAAPLSVRADWVIVQPALLSGTASQSALQTNRSEDIGTKLLTGAQAYIEQINAAGGIHGQPVRLLPIDTRPGLLPAMTRLRAVLADPATVALANVHQGELLEKLLGSRLLADSQVPLVGVADGRAGDSLSQGRRIFLTRPAHQIEVRKLAQIMAKLGFNAVAIYSQGDAELLAVSRTAFDKQGIAILAQSDAQPSDAAQLLAVDKPPAVLMLADTDAAARFTRAFRESGGNGQLFGISRIDFRQLVLSAGRNYSHGVGIAQVFPSPWDERLRLIRDYQSAMRDSAGFPDFGYATLEGYLNARLVCEAIRRAGPGANRTKVSTALDTMRSLDLGGFHLSFGGGRSGSQWVDLSMVDGRGNLAF